MRVLILRGVTLEGGTTAQPGDRVEVGNSLAKYLINKGKAEAIKPRKKAVKKDDA